MTTQKNNKNNLKARVVTASLLIPVILIALFFLPEISFGVVSGFMILFASTEWPRLMGKTTLYDSMIFVCLMILSMALGLFVIQITGHNGWASVLYFLVVFFIWIGFLYWVLYFEGHGELPTKKNVILGLLGLVVLLSCWLGLNIIRDVTHGKFFVLFLLLLIWGADTSAYFVGKRLGKVKITPVVSPNKTWEGVWGALAFAVIFGFIGAIGFPLGFLQRLSLIPLSVIVVIFSIIGDLTVSAFKRQQKLKDTGALLPGHGGLLDRIDSLLAGAPVFALGLLIIGIH